MDQDVELQEELSGIVTAVLYSNVENGYTVLDRCGVLSLYGPR